jgi:hypothetical protein
MSLIDSAMLGFMAAIMFGILTGDLEHTIDHAQGSWG